MAIFFTPPSNGKPEIAEILRVASQLAGVGALYTASAGLKGLV